MPKREREEWIEYLVEAVELTNFISISPMNYQVVSGKGSYCSCVSY